MTSVPSPTQTRREQLRDFVVSRGFATVAQMAELLAVSEMTVRRDVARLESDGLLTSFHGGVRAPSGGTFLGTDYALRVEVMREVKMRLAQAAIELIKPLSVIGIDSGTTGAALAQLIPDDRRLRVVTASLPVVTALNTHSSVDVTLLGGALHVQSQSFLGVSTAHAAADIHVETYFMTASAITDRGIFCTYETAAAIKRAFMASADQVVLISDSTKFHQGAMSRICGWDDVDVLLTDDLVHPAQVTSLRASGVDVIQVPPPHTGSSTTRLLAVTDDR